jgi:hypothetical protein
MSNSDEELKTSGEWIADAVEKYCAARSTIERTCGTDWQNATVALAVAKKELAEEIDSALLNAIPQSINDLI